MMEAGNGIRKTLEYHERELGRLWSEKASKEALNTVVNDVHDIKAILQKMETNRSSNIRWMIGTMLTSVTLILGGLALILPYLVN